jgi:hypothetical protein
MVHGWGGVQDALTVPFYAPFNQAGFAVMTFDYPGWGKSEGMPRNIINPGIASATSRMPSSICARSPKSTRAASCCGERPLAVATS